MQLINSILLNEVTKQAQKSPRLRMNHNFHDSLDAKAQRLLNALEPGTILPIHRPSAYGRDLFAVAWEDSGDVL